MAGKDPYENLLEKIADMIALIQKNEGPPMMQGAVTPQMQKDLERLENSIALFKKIADENLSNAGQSAEEIQKSANDLSRNQQRFLDKSQKLKKELLNLQTTYTMYQQSIEMRDKEPSKKTDKKKFGESRKKKFKRLSGGDKGWMPL